MKTTPDTTTEDLRQLLIDIHDRAGWSPREIAALLHAEKSHGILRDNCPLWMQRSAFFILSKSAALSSGELDLEAARVLSVIQLREPQ